MVDPDCPSTVVPDHLRTHELLDESGLDVTYLRNGLYAETPVTQILPPAIARGVLVDNTDHARGAFVHRDDCAAVAAEVLTSSGHEGRTYDVTGPELLSFADLTALAAKVSGRPVAYQSVDDESFDAGLREAGVPDDVRGMIVSFGTALRAGYGEPLTDTVERLTGRPPRPIADLMERPRTTISSNKGGIHETHYRRPGDRRPSAAGRLRLELRRSRRSGGVRITVVREHGTGDRPPLAAGKTRVRRKGVAGVKTLTYEVTYKDGTETSRKLLGEKITRPPVTRIIAVGTKRARSCDPNYSGACVPIASDVDCAGGSGNGPAYVQGPVRVVGSDIYDLDRDGDGIACDT